LLANRDQDRKNTRLPIKTIRYPKQDDAWGLNNLLFNDDGDYITFSSKHSPDQIHIMPGYLQKEWTANGRTTLHV
jgi:hypothetical protein